MTATTTENYIGVFGQDDMDMLANYDPVAEAEMLLEMNEQVRETAQETVQETVQVQAQEEFCFSVDDLNFVASLANMPPTSMTELIPLLVGALELVPVVVPMPVPMPVPAREAMQEEAQEAEAKEAQEAKEAKEQEAKEAQEQAPLTEEQVFLFVWAGCFGGSSDAVARLLLDTIARRCRRRVRQLGELFRLGREAGLLAVLRAATRAGDLALLSMFVRGAAGAASVAAPLFSFEPRALAEWRLVAMEDALCSHREECMQLVLSWLRTDAVWPPMERLLLARTEQEPAMGVAFARRQGRAVSDTDLVLASRLGRAECLRAMCTPRLPQHLASRCFFEAVTWAQTECARVLRELWPGVHMTRPLSLTLYMLPAAKRNARRAAIVRFLVDEARASGDTPMYHSLREVAPAASAMSFTLDELWLACVSREDLPFDDPFTLMALHMYRPVSAALVSMLGRTGRSEMMKEAYKMLLATVRRDTTVPLSIDASEFRSTADVRWALLRRGFTLGPAVWANLAKWCGVMRREADEAEQEAVEASAAALFAAIWARPRHPPLTEAAVLNTIAARNRPMLRFVLTMTATQAVPRAVDAMVLSSAVAIRAMCATNLSLMSVANHCISLLRSIYAPPSEAPPAKKKRKLSSKAKDAAKDAAEEDAEDVDALMAQCKTDLAQDDTPAARGRVARAKLLLHDSAWNMLPEDLAAVAKAVSAASDLELLS